MLTFVQYQHPQQWQDDKASVLLMDQANRVVVEKDLDFCLQYTATYWEAYFINEMPLRGSFNITTSASQKSLISVFTRTKPTNSMQGRGKAAVCWIIWMSQWMKPCMPTHASILWQQKMLGRAASLDCNIFELLLSQATFKSGTQKTT